MVIITQEIQIEFQELNFSYARSSGPGGQNVNKVNSKVILRWSLLTSKSLSPEIQRLLLTRLRSLLSKEGDLIIMSDRFRDQIRNRQDCLDKFQKLILAASLRPKTRKKTKPSYSSLRRLKEKKSKHSLKKNLRKSYRD